MTSSVLNEDMAEHERGDSEILVSVQGVSKRFCRSLKKSLWYGLQDIGSEILGRKYEHELRPDEFWAVNDVSFELRRGECLGLIGRNGAGKTTLLRMLNGLIKPDKGRIEMRGRVGALIALGAGFNPILTGKENIYVNASVLGLSKKEIDNKIDEIIDFAEIGDFIDSPVQTYSSGMQVRLGFAIATALNPDILILDEVLAVGDAAFRFKCYRKIDSLLTKSAVIFVSHNMPDVQRICNYSMLLSFGQVEYLGEKDKGIVEYQKRNFVTDSKGDGFCNVYDPIKSFRIYSPKIAKFYEPYSLKMIVESNQSVNDFSIIVNFFNPYGEYACNVIKKSSEFGLIIHKGKNIWSITIMTLPIKTAKYRLAFHLLHNNAFIASHSKLHEVEVIGGNIASNSDCILEIQNWTEINEIEVV
ncbi:ABC transporter ATP-binding protein [Cronbergia sp. UHCC 0137]|uniref:ABC transporter ATP-binding protein n=1 Tax=Cronbergia sp. UHCC 0137 TaxID=3110239 RepID=UPI002B20A4C7|nr:ABC transporter ATP-binding protein [Cronbergia sp. UHCC 0137]MEA5620670.1 ABC transporter ATP-binding protein [Cronbergia sp. UHCC 0137]